MHYTGIFWGNYLQWNELYGNNSHRRKLKGANVLGVSYTVMRREGKREEWKENLTASMNEVDKETRQ